MIVATMPNTVQTRNHWWWRPGWDVGARYYTWHLTFEHCHELHLLASRLRPALARHPVQDVIPDGWLHLTMTGIGFATDVTEAQLERIAAEVFDELPGLPSGVLTLESVLVADEGVLMPARKQMWLMELSALQRRVVESVVGHAEWDAPLWPHVSLSYASGVTPVAPLVADLQAVVPPQDTLAVARPRVTLMRINRDSRQYQWDILDQRVWGAD